MAMDFQYGLCLAVLAIYRTAVSAIVSHYSTEYPVAAQLWTSGHISVVVFIPVYLGYLYRRLLLLLGIFVVYWLLCTLWSLHTTWSAKLSLQLGDLDN